MIVLDTSAAIEMALGTKAGEAFKNLMYEREQIVTVDLFYAEVLSSFLKYERAGIMGAREVAAHVEKALSLVDRFVPMRILYKEALHEAEHLGHTPYDMFYFVLARRNAATLYTLDKRLIKLALRNGLNCVYDEKVAPGETWTIRAETERGPAAR